MKRTGTYLVRVLSWLYAGALVYASIVPPSARPETPLPHYLEHLVAFGILGILFSITYRSRPMIVALAGVAFAIALECAQLWVPGRHARWLDLVMDALGFCIGAGMGRAMSQYAIPGRKAESENEHKS
jgi:VanZ family protein